MGRAQAPMASTAPVTILAIEAKNNTNKPLKS